MKRLLCLAITLFLSTYSFSFAEITRPYTLDEKPQVLFGDTAELGSYKGLENYAYNYINNYLHLTFTLTHTQCCFASYPPKLYVTSIDPTSTSTNVAIDQPDVFALRSGTDPTDWYSYEVQFDPTGYNVVVLQGGATSTANFHYTVSGISDTSYAALANTYPRQSPINQSSMSFAPLPIYRTPVATTTPVIIVPGIMSSKLEENGELIWPNTSRLVTSITDDFLDILSMDQSGSPINRDVNATEIIKELNSSDYYSGLITNLGVQNYDENLDIFDNFYDWRLDIEDLAQKLKKRVDEIKVSRGVDKINLVAHSMGGLIFKKYLQEYGGDSIEKFIDVGTPHIGAPSAYKTLIYGDNLGVGKLFGLVGINAGRIKQISQNMPSVYQLLPSRSYFNDSEDGYQYYVFNGVEQSKRLTFDETSAYLKTSGRNSALVDRADTLHREIDGLNPADYGVEAYNIVGCGVPTLGQFYLFDDSVERPSYGIRFINGDGTVPLRSAEAMVATSTYYVRGVAHALLPSTSGVKELITGLLTATSANFDISPYSSLAMSASGCSIPDGQVVSFHSPIELHIYDSSGNHVGPDENGDIENEINGVVYEVLDDNKFAFLPAGADYTVRGSATGAGHFDVRIEEVVSGQVATTTVFANIPLIASSQSVFTIGSTTPSLVYVDERPYNNGVATTGLLESAGRPVYRAEVAIVTSSAGSTNIASAPIVAVEVEVTATSTTTSPSTFTPAKAVTTLVPKNITPATSTVVSPATSPYANTALVYKSFGERFTEPLKKLWLWVKKRF